ncbi:rRNA pseudouridine synthase [Candidatus Nomurabacteria bacterium]|nr:rRNA pseudouridine synthase [Candidatus Nomurabacteria bacterium]
MQLEYPIRINKYLAQNNYSTRLGADELIKKGKVFINGHKAVLGDKVYEGDEVVVDEKGTKKSYVYYAYNKAKGIVTSAPQKGEKDIMMVTKFPIQVFPIGRLDKDSTGLLIITNDGRVTDRLLSPKYVHEKEYVVKLANPFTDLFLEKMQSGVRFDGFVSRKCKAWRKTADTFHIILTEGKKRQIRRMCEALHQDVKELKRVRVMNIQIGALKPGEYREIKGQELKDFLSVLKLI